MLESCGRSSGCHVLILNRFLMIQTLSFTSRLIYENKISFKFPLEDSRHLQFLFHLSLEDQAWICKENTDFSSVAMNGKSFLCLLQAYKGFGLQSLNCRLGVLFTPGAARTGAFLMACETREEKLIADDLIVQAREATDEDLLVVHTRRYLNKLKWSFVVATITEIPPVAFLPNFVVQRKVLKPLRTQTGGTIMAGKLAVDRGWAINVGGGFHHCSSDKGGGFCAYADITLAIKFLFERVQGVSKATIIDLDAHQGNGHERDFMDDHRVYIMDVYNRYIYPGDGFAKRAIKRKVELEWGTEDTEYLQKVHTHVEGALNEVKPDVIVYNAGTDILDGDPLGGLAISPQGIVKRDEVVFKAARSRRIPILMVTSGGYQKRTARIIADSILNLHSLGLIDKELAISGAGNPKCCVFQLLDE
ncbi:histone deacetylase 11 isoform X2 [Rissa tridactyla]|uniref:histone deacetylase 11 isoform X2 n=1 Tax=Rissa tridactyla TaxID=75485 RepID=UPI0023BAE01B|nr:histone deacetylase 11 isoform X2 [Rissa tridactyla]